ncbi:delta and Notch-like epidermal growth factor-related receptor isoform X1 [Neovison vison]|uniref:delta and Notch-like epidermal growth factor-related receptor isoform X1 n=2 Tax=Neovison vison TaxID=452646 RepID=UPI001CEFF7B4|nr:delta and Notch-like epidermal growth factor-related receptor isoform X1 [Neogale vison]
MPPRRALAPGAQLLPTSALLLLLLGAGPRGCCLASPVPAAPLPAPGPCAAQPCRNGGVCTPHPAPGQQSPAPAGEPGYSCTCPDGVSGANCQLVADPCASTPCHHGNCSSSSSSRGGYLCICNEGYEGPNCDQALPILPASGWTESMAPRQLQPVPATQEPDIILPRSQATVTLPTWQPKTGQKVVEMKWDQVEVVPDIACGNASSNSSAGGRLVSFEVPQNASVKIRQDATASLILLWKVTATGFQQCSLIDGRSVTLLQAPGGLVLLEEMLALGHNHFIGFVNDSVTKSIVALRLTLVVKASTCVSGESHANDLECSGKGKCTTKPSEATFSCTCEDQYVGTFCEEFDACQRKPCQNNASCVDANEKQDGSNFTCVCLAGYTGELCQSKIDYCILDPCRNGATCVSNLSGFTCQCPEGYFGAACEEKVDPCASSPCQNNGTCHADGLHFSCSCSAGFTGPACAQLVDFCALSPCAHGTCHSVGTSYKCLCDPGYHGLYCEEEYNECLSAPCLNAATCRDLVNGYECVCLAEYKGIHCESYKDPCANVSCLNGGTCDSEGLNGTCVCAPGFTGDECDIDINECDSNPCHHAGTCLDQPNGYTCHCPHGWVGANCEIHLQWKSGHMAESLTNMPRHSLYIIIGALCVAFILMLIILIVGICRISRIEYQGSSRPAYEEFYNCRSIDSEFSNAIASIRHARFGKKSRPAMYDVTPIAYEDYSPDDKPLVTLIKTKDL